MQCLVTADRLQLLRLLLRRVAYELIKVTDYVVSIKSAKTSRNITKHGVIKTLSQDLAVCRYTRREREYGLSLLLW